MLSGKRIISMLTPAAIGCMLIVLTASAVSAAAARSVTPAPDRWDRVVMDRELGTAEIARGKVSPQPGLTSPEAAYELIAADHEIFKLDNPAEELQVVSDRTDHLGLEHIRFRQEYKGLRVWGCEKIAHRKAGGDFYLVAGQTIPTPSIDTNPTLDPAQASRHATDMLRAQYPDRELQTFPELLIYPGQGKPHLAYLVTVTDRQAGDIRWRVFVDAHTGEILFDYNDIQFDGPTVGSGENIVGWPVTIQTYQIGSDYYLIDATQPMYIPPVTNYEGVIVTYDDYYTNGPGSVVRDPNSDNNFNDSIGLRAAVAGHLYGELTYEYFLNTFGRNSYDNFGSSVRVNVHDPAYVNNAYWNGYAINFADGDGVNYRPFSGSLDVVAHELTHGVTEYTAGLIYTFQSGALNESFSDFFGAMVDRDDWLLADEIRITAPGFLRNMMDPHQGPNPSRFAFGYQPAKMSEFVDLPLSTDNGGVHINSGIPNKAGYLVSTLASREAAEEIWYRTLTTYMTPSSNFQFWADMTFQSAIDLFGMPSAEVSAVAEALDSVELSGVAVSPAFLYDLPVTLGGTVDTVLRLRNLGAGTVDLLSATPSIANLTITGSFPVTLGFGDSVVFPVSYDATGLVSQCDLGEIVGAIAFTTDDPEMPSFEIPVSIQVGYAVTTRTQSVFSTACADLFTYNDPSFDQFTRDGNDIVYQGSLLLGVEDSGTPKVYRNLFGTNNYSVVDDYVAGVDGEGRTTQTLRTVTEDGRLHATVCYTYFPAGADDCPYYLVDYTVSNPCDTPLTVYTGVLTDFDILASGANQAYFDVGRAMVYMQDDGNAIAGGWTLLSDAPRNLRAISNPAQIYDGYTDAEAYSALTSTTNTQSPGTASDYSVLITFGEATVGPGDSVTYSAALVYSNAGTTGLETIVDSLRAALCPVDLTGDVNVDGVLTSADIIYLVSYIFKGGFAPLPTEAAGDVNCDGSVTSADVIYLVNHVFKGGPAPCDVCSIL